VVVRPLYEESTKIQTRETIDERVKGWVKKRVCRIIKRQGAKKNPGKKTVNPLEPKWNKAQGR